MSQLSARGNKLETVKENNNNPGKRNSMWKFLKVCNRYKTDDGLQSIKV